MRAKKNEPLSSLGAKTVRMMEKGAPVTAATLSTPGIEMVRMASLATSVEKVAPQWSKRQWTRDKQKEKADFRPSSIWDVGVALARAQDIVEEMKVLSGVFANEVVGRHLHKLVQVLVQTHLSFFFFP